MDNNFNNNDEMSVIYPRQNAAPRPAQPQQAHATESTMEAVFPGQNKVSGNPNGDGEGYFPGTFVEGAKYCKTCGKMIDENAAFCAHCGQKV